MYAKTFLYETVISRRILSVEQLVPVYCEQLRAYARIWEKITGKRVAFAGLYSVRDLQMSPDVRGEVVTA